MEPGLVRLVEQLAKSIPQSTDTLTGAPGRKFLEDYASRLLEESRQHVVPITFAMIDIDYFKRINDCYGHENGDDVLRNVWKAIDKTASKTPTAEASRWGGEEFAVAYLADRGEEGRLPEAIRKAIKESNSGADCLRGGRPEEITASIGYSTFSPNEELFQSNGKSLRMTLLKKVREKADRALFFSKFNGRDQANLYTTDLNTSYNEAMAMRKYLAGLCDTFIDNKRIDTFEEYPAGLERINLEGLVPIFDPDLLGGKTKREATVLTLLGESLISIIQKDKLKDTRSIYDEADRIYKIIKETDPAYITFDKSYLSTPAVTTR